MNVMKQWFYRMALVAVLCLLAACGTPAAGSTGTQTPTNAADTAVGTATTPTEVAGMETPTAATGVSGMETQTATPGGQTSNELGDTSWQLAEFGPADAMRTANGEVTLIFGPENTLGGNSGCNSYGGSYAFDGQSFSVSNVASTEMACLDNSLMEQEAAFSAALNSATGLEVNGDELRITYGEGTLRFTRLTAPQTPQLEGTVWQLDTVVSGTGDDGAASSAVDGTTITAEFSSGTVRGSAGCNQYSAPFTLDGEALTVGEIITTKIACDGPIMQQEQAFIDALGTATSLKIEGTSLVVTHPDGQLVFRP